MKFLVLSIIFSLVIGLNSFTESYTVSIMPENDLYLEDRNDSSCIGGNGITKEIFNKIIDQVETLYAPLVKKQGATLKIYRDWQNSTVNAYAKKNGSSWQIMAYGGMARRPELSVAGYTLVICHEMGHLIGGSPSMGSMSVEGQSDYWGAGVCLKNVLSKTTIELTRVIADPDADKACADKYTNPADFNICVQVNEGGFGLSKLFSVLQKVKIPSFTTPDQTIVNQTYSSHPKPQCRLDTYFAGSLDNPRPRCWFKP